LVVVSHDRGFLNEVTTDIIHLHDEALHYYRGNFASFEDMYEQRRRAANKEFEKFEKKMKSTQVPHLQPHATPTPPSPDNILFPVMYHGSKRASCRRCTALDFSCDNEEEHLPVTCTGTRVHDHRYLWLQGDICVGVMCAPAVLTGSVVSRNACWFRLQRYGRHRSNTRLQM
jgi:hypothetical protein